MRLLTILSLFAGGAALAAASSAASGEATPVVYASRAHAPLGQFPPPANHPYLKIATEENFRQLIVENTMPVLVSFYKNGDKLSQTVSKGMEQTALALRPLVDVVVMDGELNSAKDLLSTYGIEKLPVILHFNSDLHPIPQAPDQWAKLPEGYQGDGSAGSLIRWSLSKLGHATVERVTDDHTLSNFLSIHDHLGYPKVLLITNDPSNTTAPLFLTMAQRMRKVAVFGVAHNCPAIAERFKVTEFPAVIGLVPEDGFGEFTVTPMPPFPSIEMAAASLAAFEAKKAAAPPPAVETEEEKARKKEEARKERRNERLRKRGAEGASDGGDGGAPKDVDMDMPSLIYGDVEYEEALADFNHFEKWIDSIGIPEVKRHEYGMLVANEENKGRERAKEMSKWAAATEPIVVREKEAWARSCLKIKAKGVCLVVFRDTEDFKSGDDETRLNIDLYRNVSRKAAMKTQTPFQIVVVDGTANYKLVSALGITNGVPDMVAVWPAKKKFYNFLGAINERNILNLFLDRALKDKNGKALDIEGLPAWTKTGASEETEGSSEEGGIYEPERASGDDDEISDEM